MTNNNGLTTKGERRAKIRHKKIHAPMGGTRAGFAKRATANLGYQRSKRKRQIKIVDKT